MPANDSPLWDVLKLLVISAAVVGMAAFWTQNGWDWKTDVPALIAVLASWGGVKALQSKLAPKE